MIARRRLPAWVLACALALPTALAAQSDASALAWLAGCWELRAGPRTTVEQWMAPAGGVMLGMSRTTVGERMREYEFIVLGPVDGRLSYVARPSGQEGATFPLVSLDDTLAVFEQPAHDFPKRIVYRRRGTDSLVAQIEGPRGDRSVTVAFPFRRIACPAG